VTAGVRAAGGYIVGTYAYKFSALSQGDDGLILRTPAVSIRKASHSLAMSAVSDPIPAETDRFHGRESGRHCPDSTDPWPKCIRARSHSLSCPRIDNNVPVSWLSGHVVREEKNRLGLCGFQVGLILECLPSGSATWRKKGIFA
jgi:hypothetical protein